MCWLVCLFLRLIHFTWWGKRYVYTPSQCTKNPKKPKLNKPTLDGIEHLLIHLILQTKAFSNFRQKMTHLIRRKRTLKGLFLHRIFLYNLTYFRNWEKEKIYEVETKSMEKQQWQKNIHGFLRLFYQSSVQGYLSSEKKRTYYYYCFTPYSRK